MTGRTDQTGKQAKREREDRISSQAFGKKPKKSVVLDPVSQILRESENHAITIKRTSHS